MKTTDKKEQFVLLRAKGLSFAKIAEELHISKSTCTNWERDLLDKITTAKEDQLADVYSLYRLGRAEHIKKLGEMLERIDTALAGKDLAKIPADKLLKLKLEYENRMQELYVEPAAESSFDDYSTEEILKEAASIYDRLKAGQITAVQAKSELAAIEGVRKAATANEAAAYCVF